MHDTNIEGIMYLCDKYLISTPNTRHNNHSLYRSKKKKPQLVNPKLQGPSTTNPSQTTISTKLYKPLCHRFTMNYRYFPTLRLLFFTNSHILVRIHNRVQ